MLVCVIQFGQGFNSAGPWYNLESTAAALLAKGIQPAVTVSACYPPADWDAAQFAAKPGFTRLEPILPKYYNEGAAKEVGSADTTRVRMHRFRPVYMAIQVSWTENGIQQHRCVLSENSQRRDKDRNNDAPGANDAKLLHAALPLPLSKGSKADTSKIRTWIQRHTDPANGDTHVPALGYYGWNTKRPYGLQGKCFEDNARGAGAPAAPSHCNTFKSIHAPNARCQPDAGGASANYMPKSDHDTMFKNKPAGYATWADYCDAQIINREAASTKAAQEAAAKAVQLQRALFNAAASLGNTKRDLSATDDQSGGGTAGARAGGAAARRQNDKKRRTGGAGSNMDTSR